MRYQGGKFFVGKHIAKILNQAIVEKGNCDFYEPFCGGLNLSFRIENAKNIFLNDNNKALINMLVAIKGGWIPPFDLTEEDYNEYKFIRDENDPMTAFAGLCTWGAKWFGTFARDPNRKRSSAAELSKSLLRITPFLQQSNVYLSSFDYKSILPNNSVVYCDPPYFKLTKYVNSSQFNHGDFWDYCRLLASLDNVVFVSHYDAPEDFELVQEMKTVHGMRRNKQNPKLAWDGNIERLYKIFKK